MSNLSAEEQGLRLDIISHPFDNLARLVYADWLEEHGRPERADHIRAQVTLECADTPREEQARWRRVEWEFGRKHLAELLGPLHGMPLKYTFQRGFVATIEIKAGDFLERGREIFLAHPIVRVVLSGKYPRKEVGGRFRWAPAERGSARKRCGIPPCIWDVLNPPRDGYATEAEAQEALSKACVCWGRTKAGLPEIAV